MYQTDRRSTTERAHFRSQAAFSNSGPDIGKAYCAWNGYVEEE